MKSKKKAIMLLSGGLDSRIAMKMMLDQDVQLHALNHLTFFCTCTSKSSCKHEAIKAAEEFDVPIRVRNVTEKFLKIIENPPHGHGSGVNPCIDCRILLFKNAASLMQELDASFIVTGEVLGERPMSQRLEAMKLIERRAGVEGLVLRPLSAKMLEPSIPEQHGWVNRDALCSISGRQRRPQFALAEKLGINDYPCPAGGCRLTDPNFARRMRDLMSNEGLTLPQVQLLTLGRHFRLTPRVKAVVGRDQTENGALISHAKIHDVSVEVADFPGPYTLVKGDAGWDEIRTAAAITARYSKAGDLDEVQVNVGGNKGDREKHMTVAPADPELIEKLRV